MKRRIGLRIGIIAFVVLIAGATILYNSLKERVPADAVPPGAGGDSGASSQAGAQKAQDFAMTDRDGKTVQLSELLAGGKPAVLNFWASWCPPCKAEMPDFDKQYQAVGGDVQFIMVNITDGQRETVESASAFIAEQGFSFPVYFDTLQQGSAAYLGGYIPATFFIDRDGNIASSREGQLTEQMLLEGIALITG